MTRRSYLVGAVVIAGGLGCGGTTDTGGGVGGRGPGDTSSSGSSTCPAEESPLTDACAAELAAACAALVTEESCNRTDAQRFGIEASVLDFYCAWADVVVVDEACGVTSVSGRCVLGGDNFATEDGCNPACSGDIPEQDFVLLASGELLAMPCSRGGSRLDGPVDAGWLDTEDFSHCGAPGAPTSCSCAAEACDAIE